MSDKDTILFLQDLSIAYENDVVLQKLNLEVKKGDIACILGPSGSGKTSILRAIAGFIPIKEGMIHIKQQLVSSQQVLVTPSKRSIGLVFQDFALFPHMTVQENVEFGLQSLSKEQKYTRAQYYMEIMGIVEFANKYPADLSGGQQQRVAIARAIAPQPDILLMDEAFSSLDPSLREQIARDIRKIIRKLNLTAILVTHDQSEAFAFADKIAVVAQGKLQQFSSAYKLYHQPKSMFVANFIGDGAFIRGTVFETDKGLLAKTVLGDMVLTHHADAPQKHKSELKPNQIIKILLRPDDVLHDDASISKAIIEEKQFRGAFIRYQLLLESTQERILCFAPSHHDHEIGESFGIRAEVEHIIYFLDY